MDWLPRRAQKRIFFTPFSPFSAQKCFSYKTAYAIFKVVYQASLIPKIRKIYGLVAETCSKTYIFHTFFAIFGPKNFFLAKLLMPYLKTYIRLVLYQKSEKSMDWLPRGARKRIFFTPISPFWPNNFFSKIRLRSPLDTIKSTLIPKIRKTIEPFEWNLSGRTYGRTDGRSISG